MKRPTKYSLMAWRHCGYTEWKVCYEWSNSFVILVPVPLKVRTGRSGNSVRWGFTSSVESIVFASRPLGAVPLNLEDVELRVERCTIRTGEDGGYIV